MPSADFFSPLNHRLSPMVVWHTYSVPPDTAATIRWWRPPSLPSAVRVRMSYL